MACLCRHYERALPIIVMDCCLLMLQDYSLGTTHLVDVYFVSHDNVVRKYVVCTCAFHVLALLRPADRNVCKLVHDFGVQACFMYHICAFQQNFSGIYGTWHVCRKKNVDSLFCWSETIITQE